MRKKKDDRPLPPVFVGDEEPSATERLSDLVGQSPVRSEVPPVAAEEQEARGPERADSGTAAVEETQFTLPGCLAWIAMTVSILGFLSNSDLPGQLELILAFAVLIAATGLFLWITTRDERRHARQSRVSIPDSPSAQVAAPPSEDPPAVP
jgi:hypothetical protein